MESLEEIKRKAEEGDMVFQFEWGNHFYVVEAWCAAFEWFLKSAEQGYGKAQQKTGWCYETGIGTEKDTHKAFEWMEKAAIQKDILAQHTLGNYYDEGIGVEKDGKKAFEWCMRAAKQNYPESQNYIGHFYTYGLGVNQDTKKAIKWYKRAANQGHRLAQCNLGSCYRTRVEQTEENKKKAFEWYLQSASQGFSTAQFCVGCCYDDGTGCEMNKRSAFEWYMKAALQGHNKAQNNVGYCYMCGEGVGKDLPKAFPWIQSAVDGGTSPCALCTMGRWYMETNHLEEAKLWFRKAIDTNDEDIMEYSKKYMAEIETREQREQKKNMPDDPIKTECCICFNPISHRAVCIPCGHMSFCFKCIQTLDSCPICRASIREKIQVYG